MTIDHVFNTIFLVLNKNRRGFVKTSAVETAVRQAMHEFYNDGVDIYRATGVIHSSVKEFVRSATLVLTLGVSNLPSDFVKEVTFKTEAGREGFFFDPEEFQDRINSFILTPDEQDPIAKITNFQIEVAPDEVTKIVLTYFRQPLDFVYATTPTADNRSQTFVEANSTDMEFGMEWAREIVARALPYLGVAYQNQDAAQLGLVNSKTRT